ncbi:MAG: heme exporter protein CcmB, partial [Pseudomonadota bacterium]
VLVFIALTEMVVVPLLVLLFNLQVASFGLLITILLMGTLGFAAVGTLFAASLMQSTNRSVLLGILVFPIVTPVIIAGAKGTAALMAVPAELDSTLIWLKFIIVFDLIFITLSLWVFDPLTRSE